jgi:hypothetical protein
LSIYEPGQRFDRNLVGGADVEDIANGGWFVEEPDQSIDHMSHMAKAPSLRPVTVHREGGTI